jgi:ribonuclease R
MTRRKFIPNTDKQIGKLVKELFSENHTKQFNLKQVASRLSMRSPIEKMMVEEAVFDLVKKGVIKQTEAGKFKQKQVLKELIGKVDMTQDGSAYVIVENLEYDVFVPPRKLRQALDGDIVRLFIYASQKGNRIEGEVLEVLERARTEFSGVVQVSARFAFLVPDNRKMQHDIFLPLDQLNGAKDGDKAIASIIEWPDGAKNPVGAIKHVLGKRGENDTEMLAILADNGFPLSFPKEVEAYCKAIPDTIPAEEIKQRRDFRKTLTFTIDPVDAKDFDDAISFERIDDEIVEIGVHIADVTYYLQENTVLDEEALSRATSVYLVDRVIPMLPEKLSNNLCSLVPNQDRLVFSAVFRMDKNAHVLDQWFGKGIIHSQKRFAYEEAQESLEGNSEELKEELQYLNVLAKKLKTERMKKGAINFESTEVKFKLDEKGKPIGVYTKERKDAHKLIEEFMLLANRSVAKFVFDMRDKQNHHLPMVYRVHDEPNPEAINGFAQFASRFGYKLDVKDPKKVTHQLNALMDEVEGKKEQHVLTQLAIRSMAKAIYTTKKASHFGLAFDHYTHFTSPIRRYPDVLAHRMLYAYLEHQKQNADKLEEMCEHCSQQERKAAEAERASVKYKQAEYLKDQIGSRFKGLISGVTEWGIYVEISENKCEGMVRLRDLKDDFYVLDAENYTVVGQKFKNTYRLGDEVEIEVKKVDLIKRQIDFEMIS